MPYLCCIKSENYKKSFIGSDCALQMLIYLGENFSKTIRIIAHNASYNFRFIIKHLTRFNEISKGTRLISEQGFFGGLKILIKCSYHLISSPLSKFGKMFKIQQGKEIMHYNLYTEDCSITKQFYDINYVVDKYIIEKDKEHFLTNLTNWNLVRDDNTYDIIEYSRRYCEIDCDVLEQGYNTFRSWILDLEAYNKNGDLQKTNLDINDILTSASLAHKYMLLGDCYDGVYEMKRTPQQFIQRTVVGGRTMMCKNEKNIIDGSVRKIADFDGVSLYPSAMLRMDGFLRGKPKVIKDLLFNSIKNYNGYFVKIHIHNIPVKRNFPLASFINKKGVRMFENSINNDIYLDKIQLEDLMNFHGLTETDFTILQGYYFDDGFNKQINKNIEYLFNKRKAFKQVKNLIQEIYKLIMNSAYGKSIMKEVLNEYRIFDDEITYDIFVSRNYNWIEEIVEIDDCNKKKVKMLKPISEHTNICQVGSSVLSWSKRIMNEVMCLAEDNNIDMFYQDTDSIHIYQDNIQQLGYLFYNKYGKV